MALPAQGPIARRALEDAQTPEVLSIRETGGNNRGRWVKAILAAVGLAEGNPWCMAFIILRLVKAAAALGLSLFPGLPRTGSTVVFARWAYKRGWFLPISAVRANPSLALPGDLVFFSYRKFRTARWRGIGHVGIIRAVHDWGFFTIEGNTGPDGGRDGNGVFEKARDWDEIGAKGGIVRLPF
jgi:hypothetical protein